MNSSKNRFTVVFTRLDTIEGQRYTLAELAQAWGALADEETKTIVLPMGWRIGRYGDGQPTTRLIRDTRGQTRGMLRDAEELKSKVWMGRLHPLNRYRIREIEKGKFVLFDNAKREFVLTFDNLAGHAERFAYAASKFPNFISPLVNWDDPDIPLIK